jgi:hypothetical protein
MEPQLQTRICDLLELIAEGFSDLKTVLITTVPVEAIAVTSTVEDRLPEALCGPHPHTAGEALQHKETDLHWVSPASEPTTEEPAASSPESLDWLRSLLPRWLSHEALVGLRAKMLDHAKNDSGPLGMAAGLLMTTLASYSFALRDSDSRNVANSIRDVGHRLFGWSRELQMPDSEATDLAKLMAVAINSETVGRCEIEVPMPGTPAHPQTMNFQPRQGSSEQTVLSVHSWCVRGPKREVIHRASVIV